MKKYSFGLTASLKSALLILVIATFALATATLKQTKITQAANTAVSQTVTSIKAAVAPVASATMMQNPVCSALPVPSVQRGTDITSSVGLLNDFVVGDFNNDGKKDVVVEAWLPPGGGFPASHSELRTYLGNGSGGFTLAGTYSTDYNRLVPGSAADFNGDGRQDVLMYGNNSVGTGPQTINVITANANGVLGTTAEIFNYVNSDQYGRATLKTGDFNNDGRADFTLSITCCPDANYVYLSNPNGTHTRTTFNWGGSRVAIVGDINGDGNQDLVTSDNYYHAYTIRLGNGRGQFTNGQLLDYGVYLSFIGATDYNKDGRVDFVTYTGGNRAGLPDVNSNKILVLTSNSAGQITRFLTGIVPDLNPPALTTPVATGDFTGDGNLDFVDGNTNAFISNGANGIFCASSQLVSGVTNSEVLGAADFNGDSKDDLLRLGQRFDSKIEVWLSGTSSQTNTPPTITAAASPTLLPGVNYPNISIATVNDAETPRGNLVVTATAVPAGIALTNLTNVNGAISALIEVGCIAAVGQNQIELTVTDGNGATAKANFVINVTAPPLGQDIPDVVTIAEGMGLDFSLGGSTTYEFSSSWRGSVRTDGRFFLFRIQNASPVGTHTLTFKTRSFSSCTRTITINVTGETPTCTFPRFTKQPDSSIPGIRDVEKGDFNKDGKTDLAVFSRLGNGNLRSTTIRLGNGQGGFTTGSVVLVSGSEDAILRVADYNGDGWSDVFLFYPQSIGVLINQGNGQFSEQTVVPLQTNTRLVGDFNNDRKADFFSINYTTGRLITHLGNGSGGFTAIESPYSPTDPRQNFVPLTGDFNGDGKLDVLLYSRYYESHDYYYGDGVGKLSGTKGTSFGWTYFGDIADYNKDGKDEANFSVAFIDGVFFPNDHERLYFLGKTYPGFYFGGIAGDFNGDGRLDLAIGNRAAIQDANGNICAAPNVFDTFSHELAADLDGDGKDDVVSPRYSSNSADIVDIYLTGGGAITNTPPKFETIASLTIDKGYELSSKIIGNVSDAETPPSQMKLEAVSVPTGITVSRLDSSSGDVYATISADCSIRAGEYVVQLKVTDGGGASATASLKVIVRENAPLTAPVYQDVVITALNTEATVQPVILQTKNGQATQDDSNLQFSASAPDFPGRIQMNGSRPFISEATKPGNYTVTVTARERCGLSASTKFNLTVQPPAACPAPSFGSSSKYGVGDNPRAMALGDFNNDKQLDLLVGNLSDSTGGNGDVSLLLNTGNGAFGTATNFRLRDDAHANPRSVAVGDFNNDGNLDAVIGNAGFTAPGAFGSVILMLGNGKGNLTKSVEVSLGENSVGAQLALGDFNKDGKLDVAVINTMGGGFVFVFLGDGAGGFATVKKFAVGFPPRSPFTIATGDFNKDNNLDIVVADEYALNLSLGDGQGNFSVPRIFFQGLGETPVAIVVADFNRDNNPDVATLNQRSRIVIKLGDGKSDFPQTTAYQLDALGGGIGYGLAAGDFDGDRMIDLVATGNNSVTTLTRDGNGGFCTATKHQTGISDLSIVAGDLNGDGLADVAITDTLQKSVQVFLNTTRKGNGCELPVFNPAVNYAANTRPYGLTSGDFNGDGRMDLVTTNLWDHTITVLTNNGNGFTKAAPIAVGVLPNYVAARDLNGDNRLDLAVVNRGSDTVTILLGNGNGTFTKKGDYGVGNKSTGVMVGDFNVDGKLDLLLPNDGLGNVAVLNGNGDGSFQPLRFFFAGGSPQPGVVGDFNGDGRDDVALPNYFAGSVILMFGSPGGSLTSTAYTGNLGGPGVEAIARGDVNGDGKPDLVITNTTTNQLFTILGNGTGGFTSGSTLATGSNYPASVVVTDFNRDGRADIAVGGYNDNQVRVFKGLANGFDNQSPLVLPVGNEPLSLLTNDFNGDGKLDLAIANQGSGTVSVLLNGCVN